MKEIMFITGIIMLDIVFGIGTKFITHDNKIWHKSLILSAIGCVIILTPLSIFTKLYEYPIVLIYIASLLWVFVFLKSHTFSLKNSLQEEDKRFIKSLLARNKTE